MRTFEEDDELKKNPPLLLFSLLLLMPDSAPGNARLLLSHYVTMMARC